MEIQKGMSAPNGINARTEKRDYVNEAAALRFILSNFRAEIISWDNLTTDHGPVKALSQRLQTVLAQEQLTPEDETGRIKKIILSFISNIRNENDRVELKGELIEMDQKTGFRPAVEEHLKKVQEVISTYKVSKQAESEISSILENMRKSQKVYMLRFNFIRATVDFMHLHEQYIARAERSDLDELSDEFADLTEENAEGE